MLDTLEKEIARELDGVIDQNNKTKEPADETWTSPTKQRLCALGHQKGFVVSADWCDGADTGKWFFDLVWFEQENNPDRFVGIPLAVEIEWTRSTDAITEKFKKLLAVKAQQKVIVFQRATPEKIHNVMTILEDRVRHFRAKLPKERFLLAGFAFEQGVYVYETV